MPFSFLALKYFTWVTLGMGKPTSFLSQLFILIDIFAHKPGSKTLERSDNWTDQKKKKKIKPSHEKRIVTFKMRKKGEFSNLLIFLSMLQKKNHWKDHFSPDSFIQF